MNKHQKLALIVAPFLLIGGYIAADYYSIAQDKAAMEQKAGRMTTLGDCNLQKGSCILQKGPLEMTLSVDQATAGQLLLVSNQPLEGVTIAFADDNPERMFLDGDNKHWKMTMKSAVIVATKLKLITSINKVYYFVEVDW